MDVIALLVISSIPTVIGVSQALRFQEQAAEQEKAVPKWFNLASVTEDEEDPLYAAKIVLVDKKVLMDTKGDADAFPFKGLFHDYLGTEITGLVSHIGTDPPALNWIYVEDEQLKYGTGSESKGDSKNVGPWSYRGGLQLNDKASFYVGEEMGDGKWELKYGEAGSGKRVTIVMATVPEEEPEK
ncbi:hypothetical protein DRE_00855 [Drechslerella stenobrocha 248]|uniref:Uncharacterized protein n=1 Tax=Drechslerella stenobrocha 248 TaxID=1043628 RepID=W7HN80_9PEZI|nr:hypothetical protein DRE_00855 [Drechslerella stenobrocha 248]